MACASSRVKVACKTLRQLLSRAVSSDAPDEHFKVVGDVVLVVALAAALLGLGLVVLMLAVGLAVMAVMAVLRQPAREALVYE